MKPWEEEWTVYCYEGPYNGPLQNQHGASVCIGGPTSDGSHVCVATVLADDGADEEGGERQARARARLASAAPDMARVLLDVDLQTSPPDDCDDDEAAEELRHADVDTLVEVLIRLRKAARAALRKAGV